MFGPFPPSLINGRPPTSTGSFAGFADGTAAAPGAYFASEPSLGFYRAAAATVDLGILGVRAFRFETNGKLTGAGSGFITLGVAGSVVVSPAGGSFFQVDTVSRFADGSVGSPGISFFNDPDSGFYRVGANGVGFSAGGAISAGFDTAGIYAGIGSTGCAALNTAVGSPASPSFGFRGDTCGMYRVGSNQLGFSTNSTLRFNITTSTLICSLPVRLNNAYVAVAPAAATGTVTIQDSTGTTYRLHAIV